MSGELDELLDELTRRTGCMYQSDLRQPAVGPTLGRVLKDIDPEKYEAEVWRQAAGYLAGLQCDAPEARELLLRALGANADDTRRGKRSVEEK